MPSHRHVPLRAAQVGRDAAAANVRVRRAIVPERLLAGTASSAIVGCELGLSFFFTCPPRVSSSSPFFAPTGDARGPHLHARRLLHRPHRPRGTYVSAMTRPASLCPPPWYCTLIPAPLGPRDARGATATLPTQYTNDSKPWPIQIEDHEGTLHSVNLEPGQVLMGASSCAAAGGQLLAAVSGGRWLVAGPTTGRVKRWHGDGRVHHWFWLSPLVLCPHGLTDAVLRERQVPARAHAGPRRKVLRQVLANPHLHPHPLPHPRPHPHPHHWRSVVSSGPQPHHRPSSHVSHHLSMAAFSCTTSRWRRRCGGTRTTTSSRRCPRTGAKACARNKGPAGQVRSPSPF